MTYHTAFFSPQTSINPTAGLPQATAGQAAGISGLASSLPGRRDDGFWEDLLEKKAGCVKHLLSELWFQQIQYNSI